MSTTARDEKLASYHIGRLYFEMWRKHAAYETLNIRVELSEYPTTALLNKTECAYSEFTSAREAFRKQLEKELYYEHVVSEFGSNQR